MPICFVSASTGAGVKELVDLLVKLVPNPTEGNPPLFTRASAATRSRFRSTPIRAST